MTSETKQKTKQNTINKIPSAGGEKVYGKEGGIKTIMFLT